jgi:uncharacterized membrane protein
MQNKISVTNRFYIISILFGVLILGINLLNHYFYRTYAWDYAAYNFAWYDFAHLKSSESPIYWANNMSFFQDHFSFTLIILSPLYWIFTPIFGTYSLLIIQTLFIYWGSWAVYKLVKLKTGSETSSIFALILYFITYGRFASLITDCNIEIILSSLVPVFLYYFEKKKFLISTLIFAFILLGRENMPLWFIFIGIFLLINHKKDSQKRKYSIIYIFISIIYFILIFKVFIPLTHNSERPFSLFNYSALGKNPFEALITILTKPGKAFSMLFVNQLPDAKYNFVKAEFYYVYLLSGGFLLFFRPKYLLLFIPIIAQKMYNDAPTRWSIESYYSIEIVTLLPVAVFLILHDIKFKKINEIKSQKIKLSLGIAVLLISAIITVLKLNIKHREIKNYPIQKNVFYNSKMYRSNLDIKKLNKYLEIIPDTSKVSATGAIASHLAFRPYIYYFPRVDNAEYIILLQDNKIFRYTKQKALKKINNYVFNNDFNIIVNDYPILILKKDKNFIKPERFFCDCEKTSADKLSFIHKNQIFQNADLQNNETAYSGKYSIKLDRNNKLGLSTEINNISVGKHIRVSVMKKGEGGALVCSATNPKKLYFMSTETEKKYPNGWEKLELNIIVDKKLKDKTLKFYVWKNSDSDSAIFFDNLEILVK